MYAPINRKRQMITQKFHAGHNGVDLRCVTDGTNHNLEVQATEKSELLRQGRDGYGNYYIIVKPLETPNYTEIKYIHINKTHYEKGKIFETGEFIGWCIIGGNSKSLHLHFETWDGKKPVNPETYFEDRGIEYDIKGELK